MGRWGTIQLLLVRDVVMSEMPASGRDRYLVRVAELREKAQAATLFAVKAKLLSLAEQYEKLADNTSGPDR